MIKLGLISIFQKFHVPQQFHSLLLLVDTTVFFFSKTYSSYFDLCTKFSNYKHFFIKFVLRLFLGVIYLQQVHSTKFMKKLDMQLFSNTISCLQIVHENILVSLLYV